MLTTDQSQSCIMNYTHLTQEERYQIYALLREGFSKRHIASRLNCSPSTKSREIQRNRADPVISLSMPIHWLEGDIVATLKESLIKSGNQSFLTLNFNGFPSRLLLVFRSACIQFIVLYGRINAMVERYF